MNADGSNKCMYPIGVRGEPSHRLHGGHRWFLDVRPIPGQSYADGGQRRELFAIRTDGLTFQLTDQPDLEPSPFTPRWLVHAEDRVISWIARRWDSTGEVVEGGVYIASVSFDEDGQVISLVQQPGDPLLRFELTHDWGPDPWWRTRVPDIQSHDWSPNGTAVVFNSTKYELFVVDLQTRGLTRITDVPACSPVWSPDETRIAFRVYRPLGDIATIRPDGRELKTANIHPPGKLLSVTMPTWSPTGGRLAYRQVGFSKQVEYPAVSDVFVAAADGHAPANLTADFDAALVPLGWR